jgi:hypothetical protein
MPNKPRSYLMLVFVLIYIGYFIYTSQRYWNEDSTDFPSYYFAAKVVFEEGNLPYERANLRTIAIRDGKKGSEILPFLYPPPSLILFWPFTKLDYETARRLMLIVNLALVLILLSAIFKILGETVAGWFSLLVMAYTAFFVPLKITIDYGQVNIIVIALICWGWYLVKKKSNPLWIALLLSLSIVLKLYPILLLIPLWLRKEYKVVYLTLITLLFMSAATLILLPNGIWNNWYTRVGSIGYGQEVLGVPTTIPANQSIYGFLARTFYGHNIRFDPLITLPKRVTDVAPYVASAVLVFLSVIVSFFARKRDSLNIDLAFWLVVSYLIAPISWYHHMVFVFPAILIILHYLIYESRDVTLMVPAAAIALFWLFNYPSNSPLFRTGTNTLLISVPFYITSLLWIFLAFILLDLRKKTIKMGQSKLG